MRRLFSVNVFISRFRCFLSGVALTEETRAVGTVMDSKRDRLILLAGVVYFIVVPLVLVVVFLYSESLKGALALYPNAPTVLSMLGSNYLHTDLPHLVSNLVLYLVLLVFVFSFDALSNRPMLFVNLALFFLFVPVVSSLANVLGLSYLGVNLPCFGFSAVVAGVFGYLAFSLMHYLRDCHGVVFQRGIFQLLWFILYINLMLISLIYQFYVGAVVVGVLLVLSLYYTSPDLVRIMQAVQAVSQRSQKVLILMGLFLCLSAASQALFPQQVVQNGSVVNILAHYVGYMVGFFVPAVVSVYIVERRKK